MGAADPSGQPWYVYGKHQTFWSGFLNAKFLVEQKCHGAQEVCGATPDCSVSPTTMQAGNLQTITADIPTANHCKQDMFLIYIKSNMTEQIGKEW